MNSLTLQGNELKIVLIAPQIAPNTGNIARLCVASGAQLHLVRPMGFILGDKQLKRSAMDYWPRLKLAMHDDLAAFLRASADGRRWFFSSRGRVAHWDVTYKRDDWLIFGNETHGLPEQLAIEYPDSFLRIPQQPQERCLNLATAVGIGLYEALRGVSTSIPGEHAIG